MMINIILLASIGVFLLYALYDQWGMNRLKGKTLLKITVQKRTKMDALIFIVLMGILIYQNQGQIPIVTLYLLAFAILLSLYMAFFRKAFIYFKQEGVFFDNFFVDYRKIAHLNLTQDHFLVMDLTNGKRLSAKLAEKEDEKRIFAFFNHSKEKK